MTITYGFYDSISSDRLYNAKQMGSIFDGLILDGVYPNYGDHFEVLEDTSMDVSVGTGRTWFDHTWTYNDALLGITVPTADAILDRIDIVYLEINEGVGVRANKIDILEGTPASTPIPPTLTNTSTIHQYALAHIYVGAGVTSIVQANITDMIGTVDTPFVELVTISEDMQAQIYAIVGDTNPPLIDLIDLKGHNHSTDTPQILSSGLGPMCVIGGKIAPLAVEPGNITVGAINNKLLLIDDLVDDTKIGNRVLALPKRQGGDANDWDTVGTTTYTPGAVRMQCGVIAIPSLPAGNTVNVAVTFPTAFSADPICWGIAMTPGAGQAAKIHIGILSNDNVSCTFQAWNNDSVTKNSFSIVWYAMGPE